MNDAAFVVVQKRLVYSPKIIKPSGQTGTWLSNLEVPESANQSVKRANTPPRERQQSKE